MMQWQRHYHVTIFQRKTNLHQDDFPIQEPGTGMADSSGALEKAVVNSDTHKHEKHPLGSGHSTGEGKFSFLHQEEEAWYCEHQASLPSQLHSFLMPT